MKELSHNLITEKKNKHYKLSQRFLKLLKSGSFRTLSGRKQYQIVERIKKLERQLKNFQREKQRTFNLNYKHWAVALALGVVSYTASGQDQPKKPVHKGLFDNERTIDKEKLKNNYLNLRKTQNARVTELGFTHVATLGDIGVEDEDYLHADFDGDGDVDIMYFSSTGSYLLRNTSNFNFQKEKIDLPTIWEAYIGDFDGDGDIDLLVPQDGESGVYSYNLLVNDGNLNFTLVQSVFTSNNYPANIKVGDLNNDGDLDLAFYSWNGNGLVMAENDGTGNFTEVIIDQLINDFYNVGDFDNDGDLDLLVGEQYSTQYSSYPRDVVFLNNGSGSFTSSGNAIGNSDLNFWETNVADLDSDGDLDIISMDGEWVNDTTYTKYLKTFHNDGAGGFPTTPTTKMAVSGYFYEPIFEDLDSDGFVDIISSDYKLQVLINDKAGGFVETKVDLPRDINPIDDFDNDGDLDLVSLSEINADVWRNDGNLSFAKVTENFLELSTSTSIEIHDFNNDGSKDILQVGVSKIWLNSGDDITFSVGQRLKSTDYDGSLVDVDGDNDMDFISAVYDQARSGHVVNVWRNVDGVLSKHDSLGLNVSAEIRAYEIEGFTTGDIDGDGDVDIVLLFEGWDSYSGAEGTRVASWLNDGTGTFTLKDDIYTNDNGSYERIDLKDMDGDGDLDLTFLKHGETDNYGTPITYGGLSIATNNGTGDFTFGTVSEEIVGLTWTSAFIVEDFDSDEDFDVFILGEDAMGHMLLNSGDGINFENSQVSAFETGTYFEGGQVGSGDVDNDGDIDILAFTNSYYGDSYFIEKRIILNDGNGTFSNKIALPASNGFTYGGKIQLGDMDNDGDLDFVSGGIYSPFEIWHNSLIVASEIEQDSAALVSLYNSNGGENWKDNTNWLTDDVSTWFGVTVTDNRVTGLALPDNNLTGDVSALANLSALTDLDVSNNDISSIPNLSGITTLNSLNVAGNKLEFGSIEPNAGIANFTYAPQDSVGTREVFNYPVHSDFNLTQSVAGSANNYQWYLDGTALEAETTESITVTDLTKEKMGKYYVEVKNSNLPDLTLYSVADVVNATASVSGTIKDESGAPVDLADVVLLEIRSSGKYDTTGIVSPNAQGAYTFTDVVLAKYQVLADPDTIAYPDLLPTYYLSSIFWEEADTIDVVDITSNVDITIQSFTEPVLEGTGEIAGIIEEEEEAGRVTARKRVKNAGVSVRRVRRAGKQDSGKGRMLEDYELVGYVKSDAEGRFVFDKLTDDTYRINIQYPGYPMDTTSFIDIPITSVSGGRVKTHNEKVQVEALVAEGKITVKDVTVVSIYRDINFADVKVYPNPSEGIIHIEGVNESELHVKIYDMKGTLLQSKDLNDESSRSLNVTALEKGMYILKIYVNNEIEEISTEKIIIE